MKEAGPAREPPHSLRALFSTFLRYGFLAWGGPVAQIGLMHRELVDRDRWITEERFRKILALYQVLPGPEAHEIAVYFGMTRRGRLGGLLAGLGFMLPGVVLVTVLAALYVAWGSADAAMGMLLYGVRPAVLGVLAAMFLHLLRRTIHTWILAVLAVGVGAAYYFASAVPFLVLLALAGLAGGVTEARWHRVTAGSWAPWLLLASFPALSVAGLGALALISLKVGLLTFGGAYTALPYLHQGAVVEQGWLTEDQFLDALALTGMVPGPLVAVGTFIGYHAAGLTGALLATVLIFAPAFLFTLLGHRFFERWIEEPRVHGFLYGVTAGVMGLIAATLPPLAMAAVFDVPTLLIASFAAHAVHARRLPVPLAVLAGAAAGVLVRLASP